MRDEFTGIPAERIEEVPPAAFNLGVPTVPPAERAEP